MMKSQVLPAGPRRAIHVFVPALMKRQADGWRANDGPPVMAVRSSLYGYRKMRLYRKVEILPPARGDAAAELVEMEQALPGTNGRGVVILFTTCALRVWYDGDAYPPTIDTAAPAEPKQSRVRVYQPALAA
jgi:hypothetical protein